MKSCNYCGVKDSSVIELNLAQIIYLTGKFDLNPSRADLGYFSRACQDCLNKA
jgi:hypothetical protein